MAQVYTDLGPGEIIASETVRGRTQHKVAGAFGEKWYDEAALGITRMADAFAWTPPGHHPDAPADSFSHLGDEDPEYYREQGYAPDEQSHWENDPAYREHMGLGEFGDELGGALSPQVHENPGYNHHAPGYDPHRDYTQWEDGRLGWAPMDNDNSVNLPYDPTPQYPAIPGDTESTLQPIHEIDADERLSPADSISFEDREEPEAGSGVGMFEDNFAKSAGWQHNPEGTGDQDRPGNFGSGGGSGRPGGLEPDKDELDDEDQHHASVHEGFLPLLIPLAEGVAGAGAAEGGSALAGGLARGVGQGAAMSAIGGGDDQQQDGEEPGMVDKAMEFAQPGPGWRLPASIDSWLDSRRNVSAAYETHNLSDKYIDITADVDYHNDPVAQFRHDPNAYIARLGHVMDEPISAEMEHYGQLVEADASIREAAWSDVRSKAMRLRREGRVHVKDVAPDRIYASVDGDHGTYDVMIAKGGAFGGFGGGHTITNWRCACKWGQWAFKRQLTYVGRLCSHGYAAYMEMNSNHMKGAPRQRKLTRPYKQAGGGAEPGFAEADTVETPAVPSISGTTMTGEPYTNMGDTGIFRLNGDRHYADALQNVPQRLVPELVVNSEDDARMFLDVEKDERKDTGPDDVMSDEDIVHFARVMTACESNNWPYPRELIAFLERLGEDQTKEDWKIEDAGEAAGSALNEIRDWADTPQVEDFGHMDERNDDIRDAVEQARDGGTDASQLVAFRTAAPWNERNDHRTPVSPYANGEYNPAAIPGVSGGPNTSAPRDLSTEGTSTVQRGTAPWSAGPGNSAAPGDISSAGTTSPKGGPLQGTPAGNMINPAGQPPPGGGAYRPGGPAAGGGPEGAPPAAPGNTSKGGGENRGSPGVGDAADKTKGDAIGQGDYKIQQGDTLSDIAQRSGYGGDYKALGDQNADVLKGSGGGSVNYDKINAGDTIKIGDPKGTSPVGVSELGNPAPTPGASGNDAARAAENPVVGPGGPVNQNAGNPAVENAAAQPPAAAPATPPPAAPAAPSPGLTTAPSTPVDTSAAAPGSKGSSGGGADVAAATPKPAAPAAGDQASPSSPGMDMSGISNAIGQASNLISPFISGSRHVFADQGDYDEWVRYAYPDGTSDHKPFNGSGGDTSIQYTTSEEYADKARKNHDDVTDLENHNVVEGKPRTSGIRRAGHGPSRTVTPTVVREQHIKGSQGHRTVEAAMEEFANFDPLAARRPEDFDDDSAAIRTAAAGGDIVAQFHQSGGAQAVMSSAPAGQDNFDIAGAAAGFLRTAGRNYSLAEQSELIREGDIGGASNLDKLQLAGTHYEAEHSVGLW